jgi:hypothetical protein
MARASLKRHEEGTVDQTCEGCGNYFVLVYLWGDEPGAGQWLCTICAINHAYVDAVAVLEDERRKARASVSDAGSFAFAPAPGHDTQKALFNAQKRLAQRAGQVLGTTPPERRKG